MRHIFLNKIEGEYFILDGEKFHHIYNVLRIRKTGENINVIFNNKKFETIIEKINKDHLKLKIIKSEEIYDELPNIDIIIANIDFEKIKLIVEKLSEIGIKKIYLYKSLYSQINKFTENKIEKLKKICCLACEQSGNFFLPQIIQLENIDKFIKNEGNKYNLKFILNEKINYEKNRDLFLEYIKKSNNSNNPIENIVYIVGPEGGFCNEEIEYFKKNYFLEVNLGKNILRSETAAISFGFLLKYLFSK
ncbi:MAG: 16S rRNA (uracil(1498)-N(3))-methyltransferase [Spirochaetes bacterium]|nr:16S rRNA (uracil(1498)-N(3))-methyltransferase [Spirochaetota bacterium]